MGLKIALLVGAVYCLGIAASLFVPSPRHADEVATSANKTPDLIMTRRWTDEKGDDDARPVVNNDSDTPTTTTTTTTSTTTTMTPTQKRASDCDQVCRSKVAVVVVTGCVVCSIMIIIMLETSKRLGQWWFSERR